MNTVFKKIRRKLRYWGYSIGEYFDKLRHRRGNEGSDVDLDNEDPFKLIASGGLEIGISD